MLQILLNKPVANISFPFFAFFQVDDDQKGWLTYEETLIGLRGVNPRLKDAEEKYLYRVRFFSLKLFLCSGCFSKIGPKKIIHNFKGKAKIFNRFCV